jgi:DNA segregation ATPase FtsK/SpoIIIE, S-DNA-T family
MTSPLLRRFNDLQATTLMLSGNPQDSGKIRGQRFGRLPAGRAILLGDSDSPTYVQLVNPLVGEAAMVSETQQKEFT